MRLNWSVRKTLTTSLSSHMTGRRVRRPTLLTLSITAPALLYLLHPCNRGAGRTTGKQCGLAASEDYQPSLHSPWLAAKEMRASAALNFFQDAVLAPGFDQYALGIVEYTSPGPWRCTSCLTRGRNPTPYTVPRMRICLAFNALYIPCRDRKNAQYAVPRQALFHQA
jgi:hypothetical protein